MRSLPWPAVLPAGAFDSSALAEDLAPALEQAGFFGENNILLDPTCGGAGEPSRLKENILQRALVPQHFLSIDEFSLSEKLTEQAFRENHFAVIIDRPPSAAAVEKMLSTKHHLDRLSYVVVGRKDWRFKDTFRSLPYFIRPRLFLDFPVSIHDSDPFYSPAELAAILEELKASGGIAGVRSFCPHFQIRRELLNANVIAVSAPARAEDSTPELSIVASDPDWLNRLASSDLLQKHGRRIEVVVPRVIGRETESIRPIPATVSHVWLHLENPQGHFPEIQAHLRNWGARNARARKILFADGETPDSLETVLERLLVRGESEESILRSGLGMFVDAARFRAAGGFDPLYVHFGMGDAEFLYRYFGGLRPEGEDSELSASLRERIRGLHIGLGVRLFHHQYFDLSFFHYFYPSATGATPTMQEEAGSQRHGQFRYRMEQSRDAYLSLYKASPRVALDGNIQILLRPYHWIKPHAWRLKTPYHLVKPYAWWIRVPYYLAERHSVQAYHRIKRHVWRIRVPYYLTHRHSVQAYHRIKRHVWRIRVPYYLAHRYSVQAYHFFKPHVWRLKTPVVAPYHFFQRHKWRPKQLFYFVRGNLWRVKQLYHFLFWAFFPVRKVYYFCEYQFEKRILGLYGRQQ